MEGTGLQRANIPTVWPLALVAAAVCAVYANGLAGEFVCDDWPMVVQNEQLTSVRHLPSFFASGVWRNSSLQLPDTYFFRPFFLVYLFLNFQAWGAHPVGYHVVSAAVHLANSLLVFVIIRWTLTQDRVVPALIGALLFAVHPVHAEAVNWISGGAPDLLFTFFFLLSFALYLQFREQRRTLFFVLALVSYAFSLFCKETAVMLPFVIAGYELIEDGRVDLKRSGVMLAVLAAYFGARSLALGKVAGDLVFNAAGFRNLAEFGAVYLKLLFVPWPQAYYLVRPAQSVLAPGWMLFAIGAGCAMAVYALRDRHARIGMLVLLLALAPPLALAFNVNPLLASRYLYLPSAGFVMVVSAVCAAAMNTRMRTPVLSLAAVSVALFSVMTVRENRAWKDDGVFYTKVAQHNPVNGHLGLGMYAERKGDVLEAVAHYSKVLSLVTDKDKAEFADKIAALYGKNGFREESIAYYRKELELDPQSAAAYVGLGNNYLLKKDYAQALACYRQAHALDAGNPETLYNLGLIYELQGDVKRSREFYGRFLAAASPSRYELTIDVVRQKIRSLERREYPYP